MGVYVKNNLIKVSAIRNFDVNDTAARDFHIHSQKNWYVAVFDDERDLV